MTHVVFCFLLLAQAQVGWTVPAEGITIPADGKGMPDGDYGIRADVERPMSLRLTGKDVIAVLTITGRLRHTRSGSLARGTESLKPLRIMPNENEGTWRTIIGFTVDESGFLVVTDEKGSSHRIKVLAGKTSPGGEIESIGH
jgi:hypothetical protein